ncbi:hypothetical protein [Vulcanisaeta distributa]|uniref:hypothetical protein n=1 Tax=Vulcanisaeta distributa TaxID=164451 RepID=UPI0006D03F69|nr:hypothetical protein [Vulcanisaeta distributa]
MSRAVIIGVVVAVVIIVVAVVATLLLTHPLTPRPSITYISINAPYVFLVPSNGLFELFYYDSSGNLHVVGTYNASSSTLYQAINVINSFNQQNMGGTTINGQQFIPLGYMVVIGNSTGTVQIPVQGNVILLDKINPGYWTVVVSDSNDLNKLTYALDVGYKEAAHLSGYSNVWYQPGVGTIAQETMNLQQYSSNPWFFGGKILIMNNGTLIPWAYMGSTNQHGYGINLIFVAQAQMNTYS